MSKVAEFARIETRRLIAAIQNELIYTSDNLKSLSGSTQLDDEDRKALDDARQHLKKIAGAL